MKIYAHRGSSIQHPELTMVAYKAAIDEGADGFECDVRLTKDKQLVLWHDADL
ncbi:MAG: glycerophosphodiester phosphodiesterase, partial [Candidatus Planktophila sp.]